MALQIGDDAPDFTLLSDQNVPVTLHELRGKKVVLYFYPKDNTPGCTQQACDFRDTLPRFTDQDTIVLGISKDTPNRHEKFKQKYQLPFPLLADTNGDVCEAYGVINKKSLFGRTFLGISRSTFLIDTQGKIRAIWRKVKVSGHIKQVLHETSQS
ncbi:MAG: thioredoxin-dependent thiol peroxidase [Pseudomonadota bacterium]